MKKILFQAVTAIMFIFIFFSIVHAKIEWNILNSIDLDEKPIDVTISKDGATIYILCEKSIKVHSKSENKITEIIPLTDTFSQIVVSPDGEKLFLTDAENNRISIIQIVKIFNIQTGRSPVIGKADAPVTIVVFSDYQ
ncbi:MAG: hypothetical protein K8S13_24785 [Desulfobacula sp.]|uniref:YncE family protein n=1 Tax=Desulfobacula sp. TaxID=2593537 RepID=UPI0025B8F180|nr:hypothetical protein [Desulfobacula sp.]MCD4723047.1 hypothetical protein [Desulfobacula sp.]